jgi:cytochrome c oxidase accessory protein FixG
MIIPIEPVGSLELTRATQSSTGDGSAQSVAFALFEVHKKIYPRAVSGVFANWRIALVVLTQLIYYGLPWLSWNDRQAVLFDLAARRFYIFGLVIWPQDFIFLAALLIIAALSLFLFTAVAGRLWCGFACPQTVYTELFSWIERRIEGDRNQRIKLDGAPLTAAKLGRKSVKHAIWLALALWTGFTFVGYFTPIKTLGAEFVHWQLGPWEMFWVFFYAFATWGNAGFMREQVCKYMCPYARFQSAMFDHDTLIISYDAKRGEPRGSRSKKVTDPRAAGLGDCVDCRLCVHVCPTGIDIRNGLQYECIGCAACVDICDQVMRKMNYRPGLIRYDSQRAMRAEASVGSAFGRMLRPRTMIYAAILLGLVIAWGTGLWLRAPVRVDVIRDRNATARLVDGGLLENTYRLQFMNATERIARYRLSVHADEAGTTNALSEIRLTTPAEFELEPAQSLVVPVRLQTSAAGLRSGSHKITFDVRDVQGGHVVHERSVFLAPH